MARFLFILIVNAVALWVAASLVAGVQVVPYAADTTAAVVTYLLVALIFGVVNTVVGTVVRFVTFPLYILTLGLFSLIVNGALLMFAAWVSGFLGFGLVVDGFWEGVLGALVLGIVAWVLGLFVPRVSPRP